MFDGMAAGIVNPMKAKAINGLMLQRLLAEAQKLKCKPNELYIVIVPSKDDYLNLRYLVYKDNKSVAEFHAEDFV